MSHQALLVSVVILAVFGLTLTMLGAARSVPSLAVIGVLLLVAGVLGSIALQRGGLDG